MPNIDRFLQPVYPITHCPNRHGLDHVGLARIFLEAGSTLLQARNKSFTDQEFFQQLLLIEDIAIRHQALILVNDRVDFVLAGGTGGVHLGHTDLPVATARELLGKEAFIGLSTHTEEQFLAALDQDIDYVAIGPVFATSTKASEYGPVGLQLLDRISARSRVPVVAIGGIDLESAKHIWATGCRSVAVISDVINADDPRYRIRQYFEKAEECGFG
jgi:thiamine-phosphate pyrophosphorylase